MEKHYRLVIIGSGPAALTAAIYASRAQLKPLVLEGDNPGGQLMGTTIVENWPGIPSIMGPELMMNMRGHAQQQGAQLVLESVTAVDFSKRPFTLTTHKKNMITADAVIICTGASPKKLGCPGEQEYWGRGVSTCAVCDGALYKGRRVIIVGGGDTAMEEASFMTHFTDQITVVHILDKLTASAAMQKRVLENPQIKIIYSSTVESIIGDGTHVTSANIVNKKTGQKQTLQTDAVFLAIGLTPNTSMFKGILELNSYGYIEPKELTKTSIPGVFVAGDVADSRYRQAITSAGTGCMAALDAERFLKYL